MRKETKLEETKMTGNCHKTIKNTHDGMLYLRYMGRTTIM
jgi:hypothetical protein